MKKCLVIRWGAFGDHIFLTPIYPLLKADGWHITVYTSKAGLSILKNNPHVDKIIRRPVEFRRDNVTKDELDKHWAEVSNGYDRVINFSGSIEGALLKTIHSKDILLSKEKLMELCNINYYDRMLEIAGYPEKSGAKAELYFSNMEKKLSKKFRDKWVGKFLIIWPLSGSSSHKAYPWADLLASDLLARYDDIVIITTGDALCGLINFPQHDRVRNFSGQWSFRRAMSIVPHADLVVGGDTGLLHVAGCYDVPKVLMLTTNTKECLAKHWDNVTCVSANVPCQPCFKLHYSMKTCNYYKTASGKPVAPMCTLHLKPQKVFEAIEKYYLNWKEKKYARGI